MLDALRRAFEGEPAVAYAVLFGSAARERMHRESDVDVAVAGILRATAARGR